jgi:AraC family transcriptional regulator of adaptative response/methylated-DNA-[protein]-cysteine methyltransferase
MTAATVLAPTSEMTPKAPLQFTTDAQRWNAVTARDSAADGHFYYSVKTTGVYCRPSCPSRPALRKNVRFHASCAEAEAAGFRACKRCKPDTAGLAAEHAAAVAAACRTIELAVQSAEDVPDLDTLARAAGMSRFHFHRVFKAATGVTPKAYATAQRARQLRERLPGSDSVTTAMYDAGFNSNARFYAQADKALGMPPARFRTGGANTTIRFAVGECSLGSILVAATDHGVCAIALGDDPETLLRELQDRFAKAQLIGGDAAFEAWVAKVVGLVEAPRIGLDLPLDVRGTAFQQRVWQALRAIPAGATLSYSALAARIGAPKAVRAVASTCAANTLAVAIPCHRILRNDGSISGYRWGVERKRALLERERGPLGSAKRDAA